MEENSTNHRPPANNGISSDKPPAGKLQPVRRSFTRDETPTKPANDPKKRP